MEAKNLQDILISILRSELNETELDSSAKAQLSPDIVAALYPLSKRHDLAHIVSSSMHRCGISADAKTSEKYTDEELLSVYRYEQIRYAYQQICEIFDEAKIPYIPLKGSVIRTYYPSESMRTSCDIDILVKEETLDSAVAALVAKGYCFKEKNYHDVSIFSPANVHLELHFNIFENIEKLDAVLKNVWDYAKPVNASRYELTDEFFLFHMIAHGYYHFLSGGCGIRTLMDIWILKQKMGVSHLNAKELLEQAGIYKFAVELENLADICFAGKPKDDFSDILLSYIFDGGVYGNTQNRVAIKKAQENGSLGYLSKSFALSYKAMKGLYPVLEKWPILLPFCWIARIFRMIFKKRTKETFLEFKKATAELKKVAAMSEDETDTIKQIQVRLEL